MNGTISKADIFQSKVTNGTPNYSYGSLKSNSPISNGRIVNNGLFNANIPDATVKDLPTNNGNRFTGNITNGVLESGVLTGGMVNGTVTPQLGNPSTTTNGQIFPSGRIGNPSFVRAFPEY